MPSQQDISPDPEGFPGDQIPGCQLNMTFGSLTGSGARSVNVPRDMAPLVRSTEVPMIFAAIKRAWQWLMPQPETEDEIWDRQW